MFLSLSQALQTLKAQNQIRATHLSLISSSLEDLDRGDFRNLAYKISSQLNRLFLFFLEGRYKANTRVVGVTLAEEQAKYGFWKIGDQEIDILQLGSSLRNQQTRLLGEPQFNRLLEQFSIVSNLVTLPQFDVADLLNAAGIHSKLDVFTMAAQLISKQIYSLMQPLLQQLHQRSVAILRSTFEVALQTVNLKASSSHNQMNQKCSFAAHPTPEPAPYLRASSFPLFCQFILQKTIHFVDQRASLAFTKSMDEFLVTKFLRLEMLELHVTEPDPTDVASWQMHAENFLSTIFERVRSRIQQNVILKFYEHCLVATSVGLPEVLMHSVCSLSEKKIKSFFECEHSRNTLTEELKLVSFDIEKAEEMEKILVNGMAKLDSVEA